MNATASWKTTIKPVSSSNKKRYQVSLNANPFASNWMENFDERIELNLLDWGWQLSKGHYCPITMDLNAVPDNILRFVLYNCNISKKRLCSTNTFSCKKHGLVCVSACGNCNGIDCENCENEVDMNDFSDKDEDRNIFDDWKTEKTKTYFIALILATFSSEILFHDLNFQEYSRA